MLLLRQRALEMSEAIPQNTGIHGSITRKMTTKNEQRIQFIRRTKDAATQAVCAGNVRG